MLSDTFALPFDFVVDILQLGLVSLYGILHGWCSLESDTWTGFASVGTCSLQLGIYCGLCLPDPELLVQFFHVQGLLLHVRADKQEELGNLPVVEGDLHLLEHARELLLFDHGATKSSSHVAPAVPCEESLYSAADAITVNNVAELHHEERVALER